MCIRRSHQQEVQALPPETTSFHFSWELQWSPLNSNLFFQMIPSNYSEPVFNSCRNVRVFELCGFHIEPIRDTLGTYSQSNFTQMFSIKIHYFFRDFSSKKFKL